MATDTSQLIEQRLPDNEQELITPADVRAVAHALDAQVPNQRRGGPFRVTYLTHAQAVAQGRPFATSLDRLDPLLFCLGCGASVELHPDGGRKELLLAFDNRPEPELRTYFSGNFEPYPGQLDGLVPATWVEASSPAAVTANVPLLDPTRTDYPADYLVRQPYGGKDYLFRTEAAGGPFPAPPDYHSDANWKAVAVPTPPTALVTAVALAYVRGVVLPQNGQTPGVLHALYGNWNSAGTTVTVEVQAGLQGFAALGTLVVGSTRTAVQVDVAAGAYGPLASPTAVDADLSSNPTSTTRAASVAAVNQGLASVAAGLGAPQWVAGKQTAGSLVYNDAAVWRVKQAIANSQAGPTVAAPNAQYYEFIGSLAQQATVQQHTQQLATLQAQGGRNRGAWAASTAYKQYDWVTQDGLTYYAKADFTSASSFNVNNWTPFGAGLTPAQVVALNPLTFPVMVVTATGLKGYTTLADALDFFSNYASAIIINGAGIRLEQDATAYAPIFSYRGTITLADGVTLGFIGGLAELHNTTLVRDTARGAAGTGAVKIVGGQGTGTGVTAAQCLQLVNSKIDVPFPLDSSGQGLALRGKSQVKNVVAQGAGGQVYYYDLSPPPPADAGIVLNDRRPGAASGGGGGATNELLQLYTPDANNRVVPLALLSAVTILGTSALAARNVSAITFQVNHYDAGSSAWVAGAERTVLADANADLAALTASQYAAGAELLFKVAAVDTTKAARGLATISI